MTAGRARAAAITLLVAGASTAALTADAPTALAQQASVDDPASTFVPVPPMPKSTTATSRRPSTVAPTLTTPSSTPTEAGPDPADDAPSVSAGGQQGQKTVGKALRKATGEDEQSKQDAAEGKPDASPIRQGDGVPTAANPTFSQALPGAAPIGV
ncbi:MAG TPA: hypothetical protein VNT03_07230, partial [Baekduia sp.]|nr:hypothetical protein [Baekduia sp.]